MSKLGTSCSPSNNRVTSRPRRYLFLSLLGTSLFAILAVLVASGSGILVLDARITSTLFEFTRARPGLRQFVIFITDLGAGRPLWYVGAATVLALLIRRETVRALIWGVGLLACQNVSAYLKGQFERPRPEFSEIGGFSFPSGHAWGTSVVYGMLALAVLRIWHGSRWRWVIACGCWLFIALVALSRPMLGVHYPSDVLAGTSLGLAWGFYWMALADWRDLLKMRGSAARVEETKDPASGAR